MALTSQYPQHRINDPFNEMDLFVSWLNDEKDLTPALLRAMFVDRQFAPLPLKGDRYEARLRAQGTSAMQLTEKVSPEWDGCDSRVSATLHLTLAMLLLTYRFNANSWRQ